MKRFTALVLSMAMAVSSLPAMALAEDQDTVAAEETEETIEEDTEEEPEDAEETTTPVEVSGEPEEEEPDEEVVVTGKVPTYDAGADDIVHVKSAEDFGTLSDGCYILDSSKTYILDDDISTAGRIVIGKENSTVNVTIDLNGKTIDRGLKSPVEGGGVFGILAGGTLTVKNGTVTGGYRGNGNGGGFNVDRRASLILEDVTVEGNKAEHAGGGIYANGYESRVTLKGTCKVRDNTAGTYGGGIFLSSSNSSITLEGTGTVTGNTAGKKGNGIYVSDHGYLIVKDTPRVTGNGSSENVYMDKECLIKVNGSLGADTRIGVTQYSIGATPITEGYYNYPHSGTPDKMFICEMDDMFVEVDKDDGGNDEVWFAYEYISRSWDADQGKVVDTVKTIHRFTPFVNATVSGDNTVDISNWYVVNSDMEISERQRVRCLGTANILLLNGYTLKCDYGILVESGNTLNIYGQKNDKGNLIATGFFETSGIGGGNETSTGVINIHGGTIESHGDGFGAGIGGGDETSCGAVTIYGGNVTAKGGAYAPGIGCGQGSRDLGNVRICGGIITATGGSSAPGIGGSGREIMSGSGDLESGKIEIKGGVVNSIGKDNAAALGGGSGSNACVDITISGGEVTAVASGNGAGIGAGNHDLGGGDYSGNIVISGGKVVADSPYYGAGIGSGEDGDMTGTITISGGTVEVTGDCGGAVIGAGKDGDCTGTVNISGGSVKLAYGNHRTCIYIGHGEDGNGNGTLNIGNDLCVFYEGSAPVAAADRVSTCQKEIDNDDPRITLHIEPCSHPNGYVSLDDTRHKCNCSYCKSVITEDHDYKDGVCTVCGHTCLGARLAGYSLSLEGDIAVNYYMELSDDVKTSDTAYMHFELPGGSSSDMYVSQAEQKEVGGKTYYVFKCSVAAKDIDSKIVAYMVDGSMTSTKCTFTVKEYAYYLIEHADGDSIVGRASKDLAGALVNYGAYAQDYFGITGDLEPDPSGISDVVSDKSFKYDPAKTKLPDNVTLAGSSLTLKSKLNLSVYLDTEQTLNVVSCVDEDDGNVFTCTVRTAGTYTVLTVSGLKVNDLDRLLTISFTVGDDDTVYHIKYCPLTYCYNVISGDYGEKLTNVCRALYKYWCEARDYQNLFN